MNALEESRFLIRRIGAELGMQEGFVDQLAAILDSNQNDGDGSFDEDSFAELYLLVREHRSLVRKFEAAGLGPNAARLDLVPNSGGGRG